MRKIITLLGMLGVGVVIGWNGHALYAFFDARSTIVSAPEALAVELSVVNAPIQKGSALPFRSPAFFSGKNLLDNTQLGMVIALIKQDLDVETQNKLNKEVVEYAQSLLNHSAADEDTEQRLLALLGNYDTRESVLSILARFYARAKKYEQAISSLFNLRSMAQFDEDYERVNRRIKVLSNKYVKRLNGHDDKAGLRDFYAFLLKQEPDNFSVQMKYAEFEYTNRRYDHVEELLSVLQYHSEYSQQAEALLEKAHHQKDMIENGVVPVPVERMGDHYIVSAVINNQESVKLIIDTGATLTILSPKVARNLGLRLDDVMQYKEFSTANGVVKAPIITLESLKIQNHFVSELQVGILPSFSNSAFSGLLGMNFLSQFTFFIDQKNSTLELVNAQ